MKWFRRRISNRIKQRHPIEVYVNGKLVAAGSGVIEKDIKGRWDTIIRVGRPLLPIPERKNDHE